MLRKAQTFIKTKVFPDKTLYFSRTRDVKFPTRGTNRSAGIDFYLPNDFAKTIIIPQRRKTIPSGIHANIPKGYILKAEDKSSIGLKKGLKYIGGVIDEDYQGEIHLCLFNTGKGDVTLSAGEAIIQFLLMPVSIVDIKEKPLESLYKCKTERGNKGFGSTVKTPKEKHE